MTDFNQKTHDTDVGSHGGQSRQMMEVFENQEFGSIRVLQEAGKTFFCASDVAKALGYVNPYAAVKRHCRGPLTKREGGRSGGESVWGCWRAGRRNCLYHGRRCLPADRSQQAAIGRTV